MANAEVKSQANVELWSKSESTSEKFIITKSGNYYTITAQHSGMALDVYMDVNGESPTDKRNVWQYTPNGSDAQKWKFEDAGDGYVYIKSALMYYMDVDTYQRDLKDGTNIWVYPYNGSTAQKFKLIPVSESRTLSVAEGSYSIEPAIDSTRMVSVANEGKESKTNVELWSKNNSNAQKFKISESDNSYTITAIHSGMALDVYMDVNNESPSDKRNVWQYTPNGTDAQKWRFEDAGDGYVYIRSALMYYMDVDTYLRDLKDGTNIWVFPYNGSTAQKFKLIPTGVTFEINFDSNGGEGFMTSILATEGKALSLPDNCFIPPDGQRFKAWLINGKEYQPHDKYTFAKDTKVTAVWETVKKPVADDACVSAAKTDTGISVTVTPQSGLAYASGYVAAYDVNGQMLGTAALAPKAEKQTLPLPCDSGKAKTVKAFFLDQSARPVADALSGTVR